MVNETTLPLTNEKAFQERLSILQMCSFFTFGGGIQRHITDLGGSLMAHGHKVIKAGAPGELGETADGSVFVPLQLDRVSDHSANGKLNPALRMYWLVRSALTLRRALKAHKVDVIHAHETAPLLTARLASLGMGIPIVMTYHGSSPDRLNAVARACRQQADLAICPSETVMQSLLERQVDPGKARVMLLGVRPNPPADPAAAAALRRELLGEDGTHLVLSLSRLDHQKGLDAMIEVARRVRRDLPGLRIVVGGEGVLRGQVEAWAEQADVSDIIRFPGVISDVATYLAASDLYMLTSRWEALPISIVEAFRAGLPVIATDCGGVRELVDGDVGRLCAVDDLDALSQALRDLCSDRAEYDRLSANATARGAEDRFSPAHVHSGFEKLYRQLAGRG
ncbi:glycosyltransferase family 4 protein [Ruegeria sp. HKCCA4812]|uniref:glycosyltransferase family 4 protein n=1 Tax=Ruegeria sp. HKCCA4812 TaxID=2682993 RepID=UPI001487EC76|nr:glycosyltransferase family 4 protein [Ruegeria sp. HKCCA4812]